LETIHVLFLAVPLLLILLIILTSLLIFNAPYSDSDVKRAISRLRTKCVGPKEIPNFIMEGCSEILTSHFQSLLINWAFSVIIEAGGCCAYI
jgi:hypothetical protein